MASNQKYLSWITLWFEWLQFEIFCFCFKCTINSIFPYRFMELKRQTRARKALKVKGDYRVLSLWISAAYKQHLRAAVGLIKGWQHCIRNQYNCGVNKLQSARTTNLDTLTAWLGSLYLRLPFLWLIYKCRSRNSHILYLKFNDLGLNKDNFTKADFEQWPPG